MKWFVIEASMFVLAALLLSPGSASVLKWVKKNQETGPNDRNLDERTSASGPIIRNGFLLSPPTPHGVEIPTDRWFTQQLDHFDATNTQTWQQRYFVNSSHYKQGGPMFIQIGGEGIADPVWLTTGSMMKYAHHFNALCFMLEHRYYGESHPTPDASTENLQYLSSEQALADLAVFIQALKLKYKLGSAKVIAFGGSYPGSLAAWMRLKYPHIVSGSIASSAPILAEVNFKNYLAVVRDSFETTGPDCNKHFEAATEDLNKLLKNSEGKQKVHQLFRTCQPLDQVSSLDIQNFYSALVGNIENVVQYNKDNRAFEGVPGTNFTIDNVCNIMNDATRGDPIQRYADVSNELLIIYDQHCLDIAYMGVIKSLQETRWDRMAGIAGRQWFYQTCTEFGYYQSSDLDDQPFGHHFSIEFFLRQCSDVFGSNFTAEFIERSVNLTNINYGGYDLKVSKVAFPNGSIDPWHALGIVKDLNPDAPAIYIKGTAHCANMYPESPDDLPQLQQARIEEMKLITKWLQ